VSQFVRHSPANARYDEAVPKILTNDRMSCDLPIESTGVKSRRLWDATKKLYLRSRDIHPDVTL